MMMRKGSVLLFVIIMIAAITALTFQLVQNTFVGSSFDKTMVEREKAELLCLGGVSIAQALLIEPAYKKNKEKPSSEKEEALAHYFSVLERWHWYDLKKLDAPVNGEIWIYISAEDGGKISLKSAIDQSTWEFKPAYKALLSPLTIVIKGKEGSTKQSFTKVFEQYLKKRKSFPADISEIYEQESFKQFPLFHIPQRNIPGEKKKKEEQLSNSFSSPSSLFELFSLYSTREVFPACMTSSVASLCGLKKIERSFSEEEGRKMKAIANSFASQPIKDWTQEWQRLTPLYQKTGQIKLPEVSSVFAKEFEPALFSVVSCARIGGVWQQAVAIIEKQAGFKALGGNEDKKEEKPKEKQVCPFIIKRLYWI